MTQKNLRKLAVVSAALLSTPALLLARGNQPDEDTSVSQSTNTYVIGTSTPSAESTSGTSGQIPEPGTNQNQNNSANGTHGVSGIGQNGPTGPADDVK
jgi:hypothetical protein